MRIVSLVPSVTETLSAWGCTPIACTRYCERPDLPNVGGTKNPNIDMIVELGPELVVMDRQENRAEDYRLLVERGLRVIALDVDGFVALSNSLQELALALGVERRDLLCRLDVEAGSPMRVFVPIWRRPWMTIGRATYGSELLGRAGFENVVLSSDAYPAVDLEVVRQWEVDVVLAPSEPYHFTQRHRGELAVVAPVHFVDGRDLFWWGSRTPAALARLRLLRRTMAALHNPP